MDGKKKMKYIYIYILLDTGFRQQKRHCHIICNTTRWYVILSFSICEAALLLQTAKLSKQSVLPVTHLTILWDNTWTTRASWPLEKGGCEGPTAGAMERSRREISLPRLQNFIINTFPPGTFSILYTVRPRGFESSAELLADQSCGNWLPQSERH